MNVWLVNQYAIPPSQPGITRHYALARELIKRGHRATIIATSFSHVMRRETRPVRTKGWSQEVVQGVPFVWLPTPPYRGNSLKRVLNMVVFAARVWRGGGAAKLERPDVIVGSSPHLLAALAAERLAKRLGVPFVLEVRDLWPQSLVDLGGVSPQHPAVKLLGLIEKHLYRQARGIITLLPGTMEHIAAHGGQRDRVVWIPNGVVLENVPAAAPPVDDGIFTVMYAGAHGLANGLDAVLDSARIMQKEGWGGRVRFRFVGDGPEKPRLQDRARHEGIGIVRFEDPVPKEKVFELLRQADAFIVTMRRVSLYRYGISLNKLYDYMASARPVVFGTNAYNDPVAEADAGLSVPPEDAPAMAGAVQRLADTPAEERWAMGLRGKRYVEEHHDLAQLGVRLEQVLAEVVADRGEDLP